MDPATISRARAGVTLSAQSHAWLVLGRVSNLPTVWSNCLVGCWLGGWHRLPVVVLLCFAGTLLYVGGMYLNDACDVQFDSRFRPERPIVAGLVTRRAVFSAALGLLCIGTILLALINLRTVGWGIALAAAIIFYDVTHKRVAFAPFIMGGCRLLLYLTAASAGVVGLTPHALLFGAALALYVAGLSYAARAESGAHLFRGTWPWLLLSAPLLCAFAVQPSVATIIRALPLIGCVAGAAFLLQRGRIGQAVSILLAAIVFVDLLAMRSSSLTIQVAVVALFCATLVTQRYVPAT